MADRTLIAIAALDKERGIGKDGDMPWHIPEDLEHFRQLTTGHPVIMGRKTWESIPPEYRPLSDRTNIVLTRNPDFEADGAIICNTIEGAVREAEAQESGEIFIIGGSSVYEQFLPRTDRLELTLIDKDHDCDTFFPPYKEQFEEVSRESHYNHHPSFAFCTFERK